MIAFFPGSFDPFTIGHKDIADRALAMFDKLVIAIGYNENKKGLLSPEERKARIESVYKDNPRVEVILYNTLTADLAKELGATIIKGVRSVKDFEYERDQAETNRKLTGVETLLLCSSPEVSAISSTLVRELMHFGKDVSPFLP